MFPQFCKRVVIFLLFGFALLFCTSSYDFQHVLHLRRFSADFILSNLIGKLFFPWLFFFYNIGGKNLKCKTKSNGLFLSSEIFIHALEYLKLL